MQAMCVSRVLVGAAFVLSPMLAFAQNDPSEAPMQQTQREQQQPGAHANAQSQQLPQDSSGVPGMTGQQMKDKIFLRKSAEGGIAEVKFGQLAADKAGSEDVKTFGGKMVADHTLLNDEMKPIADSIGVRLPKAMNKMDQAEYDKLSALTGDEFDKEYLAEMVKDHRKDMREFHEEATSTNDPSLKAAVEKGEAVIREHTHMVMKLARDKGVAVPPPGKPGPPAL
jgi:putative membrane protein